VRFSSFALMSDIIGQLDHSFTSFGSEISGFEIVPADVTSNAKSHSADHS
jgi:hypothetical protein